MTTDVFVKAAARPQTTDERFQQVIDDLENSNLIVESQTSHRKNKHDIVPCRESKVDQDTESLEREDESEFNNLEHIISDVLDRKVMIPKKKESGNSEMPFEMNPSEATNSLKPSDSHITSDFGTILNKGEKSEKV